MEACPVLLAHGFASSAEHNWRQPGWLDLLADSGRETIAVDLLGHGHAPRPTSPADYATVEDRVAEAIADREPVDAIGFSAGAHVLLQRPRIWSLAGVAFVVTAGLGAERAGARPASASGATAPAAAPG